MLLELKKPEATEKGLSIFKKTENGSYELIIFHKPWDKSDLPFSPVILHKPTATVIGILLPFNETYNYLTEETKSIIGKLGTQWVLFTFNYRSQN